MSENCLNALFCAADGQFGNNLIVVDEGKLHLWIDKYNAVVFCNQVA